LASGAGTWRWGVAEYFGRIDPIAWEAEHPAPPQPAVSLGRHHVALASTERIVPSPGLPGQTKVQLANNNLDVVRHQGRVYLAFRTAPSHFAGPEPSVEVVSSEDERSWRFEGSFKLGRDLREPRFLSLGNRLFLYISRLGDDPFAFEPEGVSVSELGPNGFGELEPVYRPGYIVWRARAQDDRGLIIAYGGGDSLYSLGTARMVVELLTTHDGRHFAPLDPEHPQTLVGGASEADFAFLADGSVFAVARNEAGDSDGWGSKLCRAPAATPARWTCRPDPRKFDSPLAFSHDGEVYVVARRNRTADGRFDVSSGPLRTLRNELSYITTAKRCSLFRYDPSSASLAFVLDLPSRGDTCFPALVEGEAPGEKLVYDYSSDIEGPDLPWAAGQRRATFIYRHVLRFSARQ
jgi:hypothetical protein